MEIDQENAQEKIPQVLKRQIDEQLDNKILEMKYNMSQKLQNLHIDLIRQFCQQESGVEDHLQKVAASNKKQKEVIAQLKMENAKLRNI